jgi:hypothetical protein
MNPSSVAANERIMRRVETEFDQRFGEALYQQLMNYCEKYVRIEAKFIGIEQAGEILGLVGIERLRRFRREYLMREFTVTVESMSRTNEKTLEENARELSRNLQSETKEETQKKIMRSYHGA